MIVVDVNVIAYLWIPGEKTDQAESLLREEPEWAAPLLWRSEFRNVLAGYLRKKLIEYETAVQIMNEAESHLRGREFGVSSHLVLELVKRSECSAYDCEYVALARDLGIPLVTTDHRILTQFPSTSVSLEKF